MTRPSHNRWKQWIPLLAVLLWLAAAPSAPAMGPRPAGGFEPAKSAALQQALDRAVDHILVPGAGVLIKTPRGESWSGTAGVARITRQIPPGGPKAGNGGPPDLETLLSNDPGVPVIEGPPLEIGQPFRAASIMKSVLAVLIMQMVDEGRLDLEDRLEDHLPGIYPHADQVTIRMMLNHTSGISSYTESDAFFGLLLAEPRRKWRPAELIGFAKTRGFDFHPGLGWAYSNTNYILLGMILEKTTGLPLAELARRRIFAPLQMKHTFMAVAPEMPAGSCRGYRYDFTGDGLWHDYTEYADPSWTWAAGALVTNAEDLAVWLDALLDGRLVSPESRTRMFTTTPTGAPGEEYGLGVRYRNGAIGCSGDELFGYESYAVRYKGYDFIIYTNGQPARLGVFDGPEHILQALLDVLFKMGSSLPLTHLALFPGHPQTFSDTIPDAYFIQ